MIKLIIWLAYFLVIAFAGIWLFDNQGHITLQWLGYQIDTSVAFVILSLIFLGFITAILVSLIRNIFVKLPNKIQQKSAQNKLANGHQYLMQGFNALAAGDVKKAKKFADKSAKLLQYNNIINLLKAQIAIVAGNSGEAETYYKALAKNKDTKFLGNKGLISQAIKNDTPNKALEIAEDLLITNQKSDWLNESVIDLALRQEEYNKASKYLAHAKSKRSINKQKYNEYTAVIKYLQAKNALKKQADLEAASLLQESIKHNTKFAPALFELHNLYVKAADKKQLNKFIKTHWASLPNMNFANSYLQNIEDNKPAKQIKLVSSLVKELDDPFSLWLKAKTYLAANKLDDAKQALNQAMQSFEGAEFCLFMADIEKLQGNVQSVKHWQDRAAFANNKYGWQAQNSGKIYDSWQVFCNVTNIFNDIGWVLINNTNQQSNLLQNHMSKNSKMLENF